MRLLGTLPSVLPERAHGPDATWRLLRAVACFGRRLRRVGAAAPVLLCASGDLRLLSLALLYTYTPIRSVCFVVTVWKVCVVMTEHVRRRLVTAFTGDPL